MWYRLLTCAALLCVLSGCGKQFASRYGNEVTVIQVPAGQKVISVTVKDDWFSTVWYLTRPRREDEQPEKFTFQQYSLVGITGRFVFEEH